MAENVTLANLANLQNDTTTISVINGNNAIITSAFTDVLSRSGVSPNPMNAPLDMNSWPIMNLPAPGSANSPARLVDVTGSNPIAISLSLTGDVTAPASSGVLATTAVKVNGVSYPAGPGTNTVPVVTGANTVAYQAVNTAQIANNAVTATQIANNTITSSQIANNTVGNGQIRQGSARTVVGVTGNATANVADIQGTTRQVLAVNTAGTALAFAQPQGDQLLATTTNDAATSGNVGEYLSNSVLVGSAPAITTGVASTICQLTITAGDWNVWGELYYTLGATTTVTAYGAWINTTTNSIAGVPLGGWYSINCASVTPNSTIFGGGTAGPIRVSLSGNTTYFLVAQMTFGTSTSNAYGTLQARRVR